MKRAEFARKTRAEIIKRAQGHCEACGASFAGERVEVDHILPAALGGDNSRANGRAICIKCHKAKTKEDVRKTRKADRQRDKATGAFLKSKAKIKNQGFAKTEKDTKRNKRDPFEGLPKRRLYL